MKLRYKHGLHDDINSKVNCRWEEQDCANDLSKCEQIIKTLSSKETSQNLLTITIMINKGRIQIQGKYIRQWGSEEFNTLLELIDSRNDPKTSLTKNLDDFTENITSTKKNNQNTSSTETSEKTSSVNINIPSQNVKPLSTLMKDNLASLEADFVDFKQNTENTIIKFSALLSNKDKEIEQLKSEITTLKIAKSDSQELISDLTLKQLQMEDEIKGIQNKFKSLEGKNSMLLDELSTLKNQDNQQREENDAQKSVQSPTTQPPITQPLTCTIPISNKFEPLNNLQITTNKNQEDDDSHATCGEQPSQPNCQNPTTNASNDGTTQQQPSQQPPNQTEDPIDDFETIIFCDSNGRDLKLNLLCPNSKTKYVRCPTLIKAK
jgi:hypothetical protein